MELKFTSPQDIISSKKIASQLLEKYSWMLPKLTFVYHYKVINTIPMFCKNSSIREMVANFQIYYMLSIRPLERTSIKHESLSHHPQTYTHAGYTKKVEEYGENFWIKKW